MERERSSHASTILNSSFLYLIDSFGITVENIRTQTECRRSIGLNDFKIYSNERIFGEPWKEGLIVLREADSEMGVFSAEGEF